MFLQGRFDYHSSHLKTYMSENAIDLLSPVEK